MSEYIKADNYIYTRNIYPNHIKKFEEDLKSKKNYYESYYTNFFKINNLSDSFTANKNKLMQICDFLNDVNTSYIIVFDGDYSFEIWSNLDGNQIKLLLNKFDKKVLEKMKKNEKIKLFKINKNNGLSSCVLNPKSIKQFKIKDSSIDTVYKNELDKKFNWEKLKMSKEKLVKKVQDYLKFKHNQILDMYDKEKSDLEDRDEDNFFKQVRKSSFEILPKARLNSYSLGVHVIKRMDERFVSPPKFIQIINEGKQLQGNILPNKIFIKKGIFVVVADSRSQKFLTVIRNDEFNEISDINLKKLLEINYHKYADDDKKINLKELEKFRTIDDLKNYLKITELDYKKDENRIKNLKNKFTSKIKDKSSGQPLVSNPPYVGDMITYIKERKNMDQNKISYILNNLVASFERNIFGKNIDNEDLKSAFGNYWNSKVIKNKGKLISMPLSKTWNLNFKTLHSENLSGDSDKESWAKEVLEIMKKPIVVLKYKYPDDENKYYVLDGSHRYNEANTKNEFRLNSEENYEKIPVYLVHLEEEDKEIDPDFFKWVTEKRIPNGNWS